MAANKERLDVALVRRGLAPSRERARALIMAGQVYVGETLVDKPGTMIALDAPCRLAEAPDELKYVSRGGLKLEKALETFALNPAGLVALDVGASTGGFTDCLLQRGAREVIAVDVGYGTLAWNLRVDPRVTVLERTNARELTPSMLPYAPDLAVIDVSFISLAKVLGAVLACLAPGWDVLALVKPQFEVGRGRVGSGGVVREPDVRRAALVDVGAAALALGAGVVGYHSSQLPGPKGNRETFVWLTDPRSDGDDAGGRPVLIGADEGDAAVARLDQLAREVER
jgi:23S rRNA (cytidine1920-2'-O)/16S rRNA (cytidine1409-2'-O)-methyltransferase